MDINLEKKCVSSILLAPIRLVTHLYELFVPVTQQPEAQALKPGSETDAVQIVHHNLLFCRFCP